MENNQEKFSYTYSAKEKSEIEQIRRKYMPKDEDENKLETIKRLDASVTQGAMIWSLTLGIIGILVMGFGMCIIMTEIGTYLGLAGNLQMIVGVAIGLIGMTTAAVAYPVYRSMVRKNRERVAPEILRLTEELMKKNQI